MRHCRRRSRATRYVNVPAARPSRSRNRCDTRRPPAACDARDERCPTRTARVSSRARRGPRPTAPGRRLVRHVARARLHTPPRASAAAHRARANAFRAARTRVALPQRCHRPPPSPTPHAHARTGAPLHSVRPRRLARRFSTRAVGARQPGAARHRSRPAISRARARVPTQRECTPSASSNLCRSPLAGSSSTARQTPPRVSDQRNTPLGRSHSRSKVNAPRCPSERTAGVQSHCAVSLDTR